MLASNLARWLFATTALLAMSISTNDAAAQSSPLNADQGSDGTLYLIQGSSVWTLVLANISDGDLSSLKPSGELDGAIPAAFLGTPGAPTLLQVVEGGDGAFYIEQGDNAWTLVPTPISDADLAALNQIGEVDRQIGPQSLSTPAESSSAQGGIMSASNSAAAPTPTPPALAPLPTDTPSPTTVPAPVTAGNPPWGMWNVRGLPFDQGYSTLYLSNQGGVNATVCGGVKYHFTGSANGTHVSLQGASFATPLGYNVPSFPASLQFDFGTDPYGKIALKGTWSQGAVPQLKTAAVNDSPFTGSYNPTLQLSERCIGEV
jgi:hypothetical protein